MCTYIYIFSESIYFHLNSISSIENLHFDNVYVFFWESKGNSIMVTRNFKISPFVMRVTF